MPFNIVDNIDREETIALPLELKGAALLCSHAFNPALVQQVVLTGDAAFRDRVEAVRTALSESNFSWEDAGNELYRAVIEVNREIDIIHVRLAEGEIARYHALDVQTGTEVKILSELMTTEVKTFLTRTQEQYFKIASGMSGTMVYSAGQLKKIARIEIVCDSNARARLVNEDFRWAIEEVERTPGNPHVRYRGIHDMEPPQHLDGYSFSFGEQDTLGDFIGDGTVYGIYFYEQPELTQNDSPVAIHFGIELHKNEQEGVFYYIDDFGWHHCVAVNDLEMTPAELEHLTEDDVMETVLRFTVSLPHAEEGTIQYRCPGTVNTACLTRELP